MSTSQILKCLCHMVEFRTVAEEEEEQLDMFPWEREQNLFGLVNVWFCINATNRSGRHSSTKKEKKERKPYDK